MKHLFLAAAAALAVAAPAAAATVVTADRMLDVVNGRYVDRPAILIGDDGHSSKSAASLDAIAGGHEHIDLPGETLLPGLIDMHVHLTSLAEVGGYQGLKYTDSFWKAVGVANAKSTLDAGFTTVRNVGSSDFDDVGLAAGNRRRLDRGPRIVPATYRSAPPAAIATTPGCRRYYDKKEPSVIDSPEEGAPRSARCTNMAPR